MTMDLLMLLRRDHDEIERGLDELADPSATLAQIRVALDGVRLGLIAHAEAEDIVMDRAIAELARPWLVEALVDAAREAHVEQERALAVLVQTHPNTEAWRHRALRLRELVRAHAEYEERYVVPALREATTEERYAHLAGELATERLRQLAMLQPSAPIYIGYLTEPARALG
jgi:hypothetical protein